MRSIIALAREIRGQKAIDAARQNQASKANGAQNADQITETPVKISVKKQKKQIVRSRLPDGAVFHAAYDAKTETWTGSLEIQGWPVKLTGTASGIIGIFAHLDNLYRSKRKKFARLQEAAIPAPIAGSVSVSDDVHA